MSLICYARFRAIVDPDAPEVLTGGFEFVVNDLEATNSQPMLHSGSGTFRAVPGSLANTDTPYWQCVDEYWTAYELATGG